MSDSGRMSDERDETPDTDELEEPSTEKPPGDEPQAPAPHDPDPDHEAVGIGVVGGEDPPVETQKSV